MKTARRNGSLPLEKDDMIGKGMKTNPSLTKMKEDKKKLQTLPNSFRLIHTRAKQTWLFCASNLLCIR
jgi:hypothetical protein